MRSDLREDSMHTFIAHASITHVSPRPPQWAWLWLLCICGSVSAQSAAPVPSLSKPDMVWVLVSACLVIFMTLPGLALFYGGLVRSKNVLSILMQTLADGRSDASHATSHIGHFLSHAISPLCLRNTRCSLYPRNKGPNLWLTLSAIKFMASSLFLVRSATI